MNNTFDFSYFVPTPDTTANCALSRWNDGLMGLSDFLKSYMSSRQSLEFGFSRNLNIKELLNLAESTVYDENHKFDYVINYRKFGDIKANVCGFNIPIIDFNHPFFVQEILRSATTNEIIDFLSPYKVGISHVYNCNSTLSESERVEATKDALDRFKTAIQDQTLISDDQLHIIFKKNNGNYRTRQQIINELDTAISVIDNLSSGMVDFIFGFESREELESISGNCPTPGTTSYNTSSHDFYRDFCCNTYCCTSNGSVATFILNISDCYKQEFQDRYLTPFGIEFSYVEPLHYQRNANEKSHLLLFFKFDITEKPTIAPFVSHDGTLIPTTEQRFNIQYSLQYSKNRGTYILYKSYWDNDEECPVYFDAENVAHPMTLESNINGMGGRDYTFWSSPVQKTESGYQFECCMPLAFYNAESDSYSNEYYATNSHEGIEIGEVMYRVPVVKRMRQNIEEAIVNTHLTKCLGDLVSATNENAEDDDTVVLGGVVVDDFTEGLYPVAETHKIATETEYGEVKIVKVKDSDGDDNGVLDLMYHYSETGELSYDGMTMPETGRAVDMITLFDTLKDLGGGQPLKQQYFVVNGYNDHLVNVNVADSSFDGESSLIINPFNIMLKNTWNDSNTGKECKEDITFMGDGQIYIRSESITDNKESVIHTEPSIVYMKVREKRNDSYITDSNIELKNNEINIALLDNGNEHSKITFNRDTTSHSNYKFDNINLESKHLYWITSSTRENITYSRLNVGNEFNESDGYEGAGYIHMETYQTGFGINRYLSNKFEMGGVDNGTYLTSSGSLALQSGIDDNLDFNCQIRMMGWEGTDPTISFLMTCYKQPAMVSERGMDLWCDQTTGEITLEPNFSTDNNSIFNLGSSSHTFSTTYSTTINCNTITSGNSYIDLSNKDITNIGNLTPGDGTYYIGGSQHRYASIYSEEINLDFIRYSQNGSRIYISFDTDGISFSTMDGSSNNAKKLKLGKGSGSTIVLYPDTNETVNLGKATTNRFNSVYAKTVSSDDLWGNVHGDLSGCIPHVSGAGFQENSKTVLGVPIGALVCLSYTVGKYIGGTIDVNTASGNVPAVGYDGSNMSSANFVSVQSGTYTVITKIASNVYLTIRTA